MRPWPRPLLPPLETTVSLSADGRWLALDAQRGAGARVSGRREEWPGELDYPDVYRVDLETGTWEVLARGHGPSYQPRISADGQAVVFCSEASDLVADDHNACQDVFRWSQGRTVRLPSPEDTPGVCPSSLPEISADGLWVSYTTTGAGELQKRMLLYSVTTRRAQDFWQLHDPTPTFGRAAMAGDLLAVARFVEVYSTAGAHGSVEVWGARREVDPRGRWNLVQRLRFSSTAEGGPPTHPCLEPTLGEGVCAYTSEGSVFVYELATRRTRRLAEGFEPSLSADGSHLAFTRGEVVMLADLRGGGLETIGPGHGPSLSGDGRRLAFLHEGRAWLYTAGQGVREVKR